MSNIRLRMSLKKLPGFFESGMLQLLEFEPRPSLSNDSI
jgi:hypothetical protein